MAGFPHPTLTDLRVMSRASFAAWLPGADTNPRFSNIGVTADAVASAIAGHYAYLDRMVDSALMLDTVEGAYLDRLAAVYGLARKGSTDASGSVVFNGIAGLPIPRGTSFANADNTVWYQTTADAVLTGGIASVLAESTTGGLASNQAAGTALQLLVAIAGVDGTVTVTAGGLTGGADNEADASLRARVLARIRQPPQGGAKADYLAWALAVPNVTRAWVYPGNRGAGTCDVTFVCDGRADIIPTADDVAAVQAALDASRPVTVDCIAFAPSGQPIAVVISGVTDATIQAAVRAQLAEMVAADAEPRLGLSLSQIYGAISAAPGIGAFNLLQPVANIAGSNTAIVTLDVQNGVTFQ